MQTFVIRIAVNTNNADARIDLRDTLFEEVRNITQAMEGLEILSVDCERSTTEDIDLLEERLDDSEAFEEFAGLATLLGRSIIQSLS